MIRWKGILVTSGALVFAASLARGESPQSVEPSTTYERLRQATLNSPKTDSGKPFHPLAAAPGEERVDEPAGPVAPLIPKAVFQDPIVPSMATPAVGPSAKSTAAPMPDFEAAGKPIRSNYTEVTSHPISRKGSPMIDARPAVHEVTRTAPATADTTDVIHAEYVAQPHDKSPILQIKSTGAARTSLTASEAHAGTAPAADKQSAHPHISVKWSPKGEVNVGEECEFDILIKNTGDVVAEELEIDAFFPETVRLTAARPQPSSSNEHLTWKVSRLEPNEEQSLSVRLIPSQRGDLALSSKVRFTGAAQAKFSVAEPMLKVEITGPQDVMIGEPASHTIKISNPGTGTARDVALEALIPVGLKHPRGERLRLEIGSLDPGASQEIHLSLAAVDGGAHTLQIAAISTNSLRQTASADVTVSAPSLALALEGPGLRYKGRKGTFTLQVHNDGTATSNNVRVRYRLPAGFEFVSAGEGGRFDARTGVLEWFVGKMEPDDKQQLAIELVANEFGHFTHEAAAMSEHGAQATSELKTRVEGTASLSLEIVDLDDPVEVGSGNAYEIRIKNDGSIAATNVGVSFEMPAGVQFVSAEGPSEDDVENNAVFFKPLIKLEPGKSATYRIQVKGATAGNHRFRARLASDSIQDPLIFEELTKYYGE